MANRGTVKELYMSRVVAVLLMLGSWLFTFNAGATKPCPQPPCDDTDVACWEQHASWIAVGTIGEVRRHPMGTPLMKDFASYVLQVTAWEKTHDQREPRRLSMQVGWCDSAKQLPRDLSGTFRFYGKLMAAEPDADGSVAVEYITFLRASCPKGHCNDDPPEVSADARSQSEARERPPLFGPVGSPDGPPGQRVQAPALSPKARRHRPPLRQRPLQHNLHQRLKRCALRRRPQRHQTPRDLSVVDASCLG